MRKLSKILLIIVTIITAVICFIVYDGYYRAPSRLKVRYETIYNEKINKELDGTTIVLFSDLHYNENNKNLFNNLVNTINQQNPDLIIFLGDLIDENYFPNDEEVEEIISYLSKLKAKYGKLAIYGDEDGNKSLLNWMMKADFEYLPGGKYQISINSSHYINLYSTYDNENYLDGLNNKEFNLVLNHKPDLFSNILDYSFDYMISGHTLGNQINIFNKNKGKYVKGIYFENQKFLDVTSGVGTKGENVRIFSDSEIVVYHLYSKEKE